MAIYDNNGTTDYEIAKLYDNNGTTDYQINKVYDNNGTTDSLIYTAEYNFLSSGSLPTNYTIKTLYNTNTGTVSGKVVSFTNGRNVTAIYWAIDVSSYDSIEYSFTIDTWSSYMTKVVLGLASDTGGKNTGDGTDTHTAPTWIAQKTVTASGTYTGTLNISSATGTKYLIIYNWNNGSNAVKKNVTINSLVFK